MTGHSSPASASASLRFLVLCTAAVICTYSLDDSIHFAYTHFTMVHMTFHGRRAVRAENEFIRFTVTVEGGHIAEILEKSAGVNPLWIPPWPSIEPRSWSAEKFPGYGNDAESRLLAGIMGHNLCLDLFGPPSEDEAAAGLCVHGEAGVTAWDFAEYPEGFTARCLLPHGRIAFTRRISLSGRRVRIAETIENIEVYDRPIAWTQHVTIGPPFLERGRTEFRASFAGRSGALEVFTGAESSSGYTANALDASQEESWFIARSPSSGVAIGYVWRRSDFPWLGVWEENRSRTHRPWDGSTLTRGMEFGVSPWPETRRAMIERGEYRWLPAKGRLHAEYYVAIATTDIMPDGLRAFEALV